MNPLDDLYQEILVEHAKKPKGFGYLEGSTHTAEQVNPLCGDQVKIELKIEEEIIVDAMFSGCGCAISTAATSLLLEACRGKSVDQAIATANQLRRVLVEGDEIDLQTLEPLRGVCRFPMRVKCATLPVHALLDALNHQS